MPTLKNGRQIRQQTGWTAERDGTTVEPSRGVICFTKRREHGTRDGRRSLLSGATLAALPRPGRTQGWPDRPVRIVEGYGPGGAPDIIARLIGKWLAERLGQPFVIDNKPGASGRIATDAVAKAAPDGYTLLLVLNNNTVDAAIKDKLPYDFIRDIAPVAGIYRQPLVMEVHPSVPANTVAEFIALAKSEARQDQHGVGRRRHRHPHRRRAVPDGGRRLAVPRALSRRAGAARHRGRPGRRLFRRGRLVAAADQGRQAPGARRHHRDAARPVLPDVPAMAEFLPGYEFSAWYALGAPKGTPADVVERLNKEVNAALADPQFANQLAELGGIPLAARRPISAG